MSQDERLAFGLLLFAANLPIGCCDSPRSGLVYMQGAGSVK